MIASDPVAWAAAFATEQAAFQQEFTASRMAELMAPELAGGPPATAAEIVNGFGFATPVRFDEFQSVSQGSEDEPEALASTSFQSDVAANLGTTGLTTEHVLNRAGAMTCGGCHHFAANQIIGKTDLGINVRWPSANGFAHIDEAGTLSQALTSFFLPLRQQILADFTGTGGQQAQGGGAPSLPQGAEEPDPFEQALQSVLESGTAVSEADLLALEREVIAARQAEQSQPGAFRTVRPTH